MSAEKTEKVYKSAAEGAFLFPKRAEKRAFFRAAADWRESARDKERGGARKSCPRNERRKKRAGGGFSLTDDAADRLHQTVALGERVQNVPADCRGERCVARDAHGDVPEGDDGDLWVFFISEKRENERGRRKKSVSFFPKKFRPPAPRPRRDKNERNSSLLTAVAITPSIPISFLVRGAGGTGKREGRLRDQEAKAAGEEGRPKTSGWRSSSLRDFFSRFLLWR